MRYVAYIHQEGDQWLAEFPDAPGCQTFADSFEALPAAAQEALEGWLEAHLELGRVPPRPVLGHSAPRGKKLMLIEVSPSVAFPVQLRWARHDIGLTQGQVAKIAGMKQQMFAKLEKPGSNPTLDSMERASKALGVLFSVNLGEVRVYEGPARKPQKVWSPPQMQAATKRRKPAQKSYRA